MEVAGMTFKINGTTVYSDATSMTEGTLYCVVIMAKTAGTTARFLYEARPWLHIRQTTLKSGA